MKKVTCISTSADSLGMGVLFIKPSVDIGEGLASCRQSIVFKFNYRLLLYSISDPVLKESTYSILYRTQEKTQVVARFHYAVRDGMVHLF